MVIELIVYDIECIRPPVQDKKRLNYEYANGWEDYIGMGIAVAVFYVYSEDKLYTFTKDSLIEEFQKIIDDNLPLVGFNIKSYDNKMLRAHSFRIDDNNCYDILEQLWIASGIIGKYDIKTHRGYSLNKVLDVNFKDIQKIMNGADAPFLWQDGEREKVIDYCKSDVNLTKMLLNRIFETGGLINPVTKKFTKMVLPS
jgi:DEAD/DEAH box helicase domain-containing protein